MIQLAELLAEYDRNQCEHVIAQLLPLNETSIARLMEAKQLAATLTA